jgi:hypothetical protein
MTKQELLLKLQEILIPLETDNLVTYFRTLTFEKALRNPWLLGFFVVILFYAVIKRSRGVLLLLFFVVSVSALLAHTLPRPGEDFTPTSLLPLAGGSLCIGAVLIYFVFIRGE